MLGRTRLTSHLRSMRPAKKIEKEIGKAEVREVFRITKVGSIAGSMVIQGMIKRNTEARLVREDVVVWTDFLLGFDNFYLRR